MEGGGVRGVQRAFSWVGYLRRLGDGIRDGGWVVGDGIGDGG